MKTGKSRRGFFREREVEVRKKRIKKARKREIDGELSHHVNTRVPSEPRYALRKRNHSHK